MRKEGTGVSDKGNNTYAGMEVPDSTMLCLQFGFVRTAQKRVKEMGGKAQKGFFQKRVVGGAPVLSQGV